MTQTLTELPIGHDSPHRSCENCGIIMKSSDMINIMIAVGSPGHPSLTGFQCPFTEHWTCSTACWLTIAERCLKFHMFPMLAQKLEGIKKNA